MKTPIDLLLDGVKWEATGNKGDGDGLPYATHKGVLHLFDLDLDVYILNDGRRIIDANSLNEVFGAMGWELPKNDGGEG